MKAELPLAMTSGDPSGIGPEIAAMAWKLRAGKLVPAFYLLSDPDFLAKRLSAVGLDVPLAVVTPGEAVTIFPDRLPVVPLENRFANTPGRPDTANAAGIIEAIDRAVFDVEAGTASAVVTCPIAKKVLYDAGFKFPGHTEYLAHLAGGAKPVMMIAGPGIRTIPVTIHIPLTAVSPQLTSEMIFETGMITDRDLKRRFGIKRPRLAISGLNPHAGEDGSLGTEDRDIVAPAIEQLRQVGVDARGPYPADTMFHARARRGYDVAICMYHDQALIPAKTLAFDNAVNVTLGLPFIRTSPDHGTAFDIAGTAKAKPDSLIAAARMASQMARRA